MTDFIRGVRVAGYITGAMLAATTISACATGVNTAGKPIGGLPGDCPGTPPMATTAPAGAKAALVDTTGSFFTGVGRAFAAKQVGLISTNAFTDHDAIVVSAFKSDASSEQVLASCATPWPAGNNGVIRSRNATRASEGFTAHVERQLRKGSSLPTSKAHGGSDIAGGIRAAAESLAAMTTGPRALFVITDGLANDGVSRRELATKGADATAKLLMHNGYTADLHGDTIVFCGIGRSAAGVATPDSTRLQQMWTTWAHLNGAVKVTALTGGLGPDNL
jgi:hypothetical protein